MMLIDTHAHIYADQFIDDRESMLERARESGVSQILMPAIDLETHAAMLQLEESYPMICRSMMGLHPCSVKEGYQQELAAVESHLASRQFIGVGEIGLDFYWDRSFKDQQIEAFNRQIELALHYDLPISIHSREATRECIDLVREHQTGKLRGVFHCFSGDISQAKEIRDLGLYLGIGGVLTFKNGGLEPIIREMGLKDIVLETDAPYLAPVPYRGKRNEPSYLIHINQQLAAIAAISKEEAAAITTANARTLFGI